MDMFLKDFYKKLPRIRRFCFSVIIIFTSRWLFYIIFLILGSLDFFQAMFRRIFFQFFFNCISFCLLTKGLSKELVLAISILFHRHSQKQWMLKTHKRSALVSGRRNRLRVIKRTKHIHSIASCSGNMKQSIPIPYPLMLYLLLPI